MAHRRSAASASRPASLLGRTLLVCVALLALLGQGPAAAHDWIYSAVPGDNIWNITERHLKGIRYWKQLQTYNRLASPDRILPGTRLRIPISWLKVQPASARVVAVVGSVERVSGHDGVRAPAAIGESHAPPPLSSTWYSGAER